MGEDDRRYRHRSGDDTARWGQVNYGMIATGNHCYFGFAARSTTPTLQGCFSPEKGKVGRTSVLVYQSVLLRKQYCKAGMDSCPTFPLNEGACYASVRTGSQ